MDNVSPSICVNDADQMSPKLGIIPPVLEMSVIIASAVIRGLLAILHSQFPVSQSRFIDAATLGHEDLAQKGRK